MATSPIPQPGPPQPGGPAPASPATAGGPAGPVGNPAFAIFAQISRLSDQMAAVLPSTSEQAEAIKDQVRLALQKAIQSQAPQQQAPPI